MGLTEGLRFTLQDQWNTQSDTLDEFPPGEFDPELETTHK